MVQPSTVRAYNAELVKNHHITAVFVGGTSGIGEYTMRALASTVGTSGRGLRAYIVGRNQKAADTIIADCRKVCPTGDFRFVKAKDLSLIQDVDRVCQDITSMEEARKPDGGTACIDLLVLTQAWFAFGGKLERIGMYRLTTASPSTRLEKLTRADQLKKKLPKVSLCLSRSSITVGCAS
jgi:NAD(P)-dependent dehydrogenase (short-subunit alcohol dehydrogenase family)